MRQIGNGVLRSVTSGSRHLQAAVKSAQGSPDQIVRIVGRYKCQMARASYAYLPFPLGFHE